MYASLESYILFYRKTGILSIQLFIFFFGFQLFLFYFIAILWFNSHMGFLLFPFSFEKIIQTGLKSNTGMCIPVNIIIESFIDYINKNHLDPKKTAVWIFKSTLACNIKMYPYYIKKSFIKWDLIGKSFLFFCNQLGYLNKNLVDICWNLAIDKLPNYFH